jgi:hypothetical protein
LQENRLAGNYFNAAFNHFQESYRILEMILLHYNHNLIPPVVAVVQGKTAG